MKINPPLITFIIGVMFSVSAFVFTRSLELQDFQRKFDGLMDNQFTSLKRELDLSIEVLLGVKGLYDSSTFVTRKEFQLFTQAKLAKYKNIQALEWIPRVTIEQRAEYEILARKDGFPTFSITERQQQGQMVIAAKRKEYFPVFYMEPYAGNEAALGFDLASNTNRLATLIKSCKTGETLATSRITLVQENKKQFSFLVFAPVYKTEVKTCSNLAGFVLGVYRIGDTLEKALKYLKNTNIKANIWLYEHSNIGEQLLYFRKSNGKNVSNNNLEYIKIFEMAGRTWKLTAYPTNEYVYRHWYPYGLLLIGLLFTLLLIDYIRQRLSELEENEEQTRAIVNTVINGIITINKFGIIEYFNPAAENIFYYTKQEVIGKNINMLMPEPYHSEHDDYLNNYLQTKQAKVIGIGREVIGKRKDNTTFPMELAVSEMKLDKCNKFVGIVTDITERKYAEQLIINGKKKAEESNKLKSEFLNTMSHELRTPLTVMLGNLPLLTDISSLPEAEDIVEISQDIEESGKHLLRLINDLLDISKIEAGKIILEIETFSISLLFKIIQSMQVLAHKKNLTLEINIIEINITADLTRLKQILFNLIENAIKFTKQGKITISVTQNREMVCFSIQDTGCGMAAEDLPYIFDTFRQLDGSFKREASGIGLGLTITKRLIELHKGEIIVTSELEVGSTFKFYIPIS